MSLARGMLLLILMRLWNYLKMKPIKIVEKEWGKEIWIVNRDYCGKILVLNKGFRGSIHHHKIKDETFYINKGKVLLELGSKKMVMTLGNSIIIEPNQKHRFTGLEDSEIIEFSSHHEDGDTYRDELSGPINLEELDYDA